MEGPAHQILMDDDRPVTGQSDKAADETDGKPTATPE
jgi:nitrogen fixation-related uncharacterized protein